ncbi:MAG: DNA methyltransferase [Syntrophomonas sp.]|nr:DNA methyltransferase [Syntrophomonas sp.]
MVERPGKTSQYFLNGEQLVFYSSKTKNIDGVLTTAEPLTNLWTDLLSNNLHNEGGVSFPDGKKPEALVKRILEITTDENDLVLDSFLGSGTRIDSIVLLS